MIFWDDINGLQGPLIIGTGYLTKAYQKRGGEALFTWGGCNPLA